MTTITHAANRPTLIASDEKFVIFASSVGTVFE
jgi:hypothetical protein